MAAESQSYNGVMHAGAGTVLFLLPLSAMIPGLLPFIALAGLFTAVLVIPLLVLGLVAGLRATPRAVEQLRQVAIELDMVPIRRQIAIARVWTAISEDGELRQPPIDEAHALLDDTVWSATTLRTGRSVAQVA